MGHYEDAETLLRMANRAALASEAMAHEPIANATTLTTEQHLAEVERHLALVVYPINMNASPVHVQIALTHALLATLAARPQHPKEDR